MPTSPSQFDILSFQPRSYIGNGAVGSVIPPLNYLIDISPTKHFTLSYMNIKTWQRICDIGNPPPHPSPKDRGTQAENRQPLCQALPGMGLQSSRSQSSIQQGAPTVVRNCSGSRSQLLSAMDRTLLKGTAWERMGRTPKPDLELKKAR